ncbi:hypothetical protein MANES_16G076800v8 [Manihot esculenta]|uniref:Uncharacterized protein n=1 Tax=Manihot esculenta TaxID=3983 RepID=A0ACB7G6P7_MANES|nr:hypothetical protein MANES_16G076800v8 [Manihot esculenta]
MPLSNVTLRLMELVATGLPCPRKLALSDVERVAVYGGSIISGQTSNMEVSLKRKIKSYSLSIVKWEAGKWSLIASHLPGRTDNDVKNYWNTKLKKKLLLGGNPSLAIKNNTEIITPADHNYNATTAPSATSSLPNVIPRTETTCSFTFWDSLTHSSVTLPILSDVVYDQHLLDPSQILSLDPVDQFSFTPGIMDNLSELGSNLINNHNIVSSSQEGSSISDSSSIVMDHNLSMPAGILMDSGFGFPYDPVTALLFEDKAGEVASSGYAEIKH